MKIEVRIGTAVRQFEIHRVGGNQFVATGKDGAQIDAVQIAPHIYSLIVAGRVFEATALSEKNGALIQCGGEEFHALVSDPRAWRGARGALFGAEGKQQVTAPMPGKVVRVLVSAGDQIEPQQGLVVVEAMKMQNEIRASGSGTVERVFVREGQAVAAGEALVTLSRAVIESS